MSPNGPGLLLTGVALGGQGPMPLSLFVDQDSDLHVCIWRPIRSSVGAEVYLCRSERHGRPRNPRRSTWAKWHWVRAYALGAGKWEGAPCLVAELELPKLSNTHQELSCSHQVVHNGGANPQNSHPGLGWGEEEKS